MGAGAPAPRTRGSPDPDQESAPSGQNELGGHVEFPGEWADLRDGEAVEKLVQATKPSAVIHLAAVLPPLSEAPGTPTEAVNRDGTRNLIQALTQRAPSARVVLASSYAVYGPRHPGAPGPDGDRKSVV